MNQHKKKIIGIVGGLGPQASADLLQKILNNTQASKDQEHIEVYLLSRPQTPDRTEYILDHSKPNPAVEIFASISKLSSIGANLITVACNTSHAEVIIRQVNRMIEANKLDVEVVNIIHETSSFIASRKIGRSALLATLGTYKSNLYKQYFDQENLDLIYPNDVLQLKIHQAIYDKTFGIKSFSKKIHKKAIDIFQEACDFLEERDVKCIIAGCTEIPLIIPYIDSKIEIIDPTEVLAKSLVQKAVGSVPKELL